MTKYVQLQNSSQEQKCNASGREVLKAASKFTHKEELRIVFSVALGSHSSFWPVSDVVIMAEYLEYENRL